MKVLEFWYVPAAHAVQEIPFFLYPDLHDAHMLARGVVVMQASPVILFPFKHVHVVETTHRQMRSGLSEQGVELFFVLK